jgi:hypothetical protein
VTVRKSLLSSGLYSSILVSSGSEPLVDSILVDSDLVRFGTVTLNIFYLKDIFKLLKKKGGGLRGVETQP